MWKLSIVRAVGRIWLESLFWDFWSLIRQTFWFWKPEDSLRHLFWNSWEVETTDKLFLLTQLSKAMFRLQANQIFSGRLSALLITSDEIRCVFRNNWLICMGKIEVHYLALQLSHSAKLLCHTKNWYIYFNGPGCSHRWLRLHLNTVWFLLVFPSPFLTLAFCFELRKDHLKQPDHPDKKI